VKRKNGDWMPEIKLSVDIYPKNTMQTFVVDKCGTIPETKIGRFLMSVTAAGRINSNG